MIQSVLLTAAPAQPPTAFRVFKKGENGSSKGTFIFDDQAAASVMQAFRRGGVDLVLDLEHSSLDPAALAQRSDAADARGYFKLEVRSGELWAVGVTYTGDGLARLADRRQRYFSPAFSTDKEGRVLELHNIALVSQPALHGIEPLAAGKYTNKSSGVLAARVPNAVADVFRALAKQSHQTPGALIRKLLVSLAADPAGTAATGLDTIRKALGLEPDAGRGEIVEALDALLTLVGGDPADAPAPDPMAAAAQPKPAQLSKDEARACARHGLVPTAANFEKLKRSMVRTTERKPAPAAAPATLSKSEIAAQVAALPLDVRRAALAKFASLEDFIVARAATVRRA